MSQLTLRDLPPAVEEHLRERARLEGRSLSKVASDLLTGSLGLATGRRDLRHFSGSWSVEDLADFEAVTAGFEGIDEEVWR